MEKRSPAPRWLPVRSALSVAGLIMLPLIVVVLAVLQYRWIGQASEADRERMQIGLNTSVSQFLEDYRSELYRVCTAFRPEPGIVASRDWGQYVKRYDEWRRTTSFPDLAGDVFVWELEHIDGSRLIRVTMQSREVRAVEWPPELGALRSTLDEQRRELGDSRRRDVRLRAWTLHEAAPALTHLLFQFTPPTTPGERPQFHVAGFLIVKLNPSCFEQRLFPELTRRHFGSRDGRAYQVAILNKETPAKPIYRSEPAVSEAAAASAIVRVDLTGSVPENYILPRPALEQGRAEELGPPPVLVPGNEEESWQLLVWHRFGSLDAVVARIRRRNLAVSFGVLLFLTAALTMLAISTRRAQRLAELQIDFVAGVSHELRTPLAVICSAGDNLAEGVVDTKPQVQQYGELVRAEGRRLRAMVEQILHFAAGQTDRRYELRPTEVAALVDGVLEDSGSAIQAAGFSVEAQIAPGLPRVLVDGAALKQCLQNLVNNALKYGENARWIGVRANGNHGEVRITVEDRGMGIEPAELRHIFEPFYRGRAARAAQIHGTGLGLNLAARIAEAMGGRITVKSAPGKGSSFTLHLPAMKDDGRQKGEKV